MSKFILIDGSSYLYRAFHALPPLSNAAGEPTGALFGVANMLRASLAEQPDYIAFVTDAPGPNFRHRLYPDYKANRPPMPDDLRAQVEPMHRIVEALGIATLQIPDVEADDVIGTLAKIAAEQGIEVEISTGDKDFAQLVGPHIELVNTMSRTRLDRQGIATKYGVWPEQFIDYLSLMGDRIDNVPGVPKCGPKTAAKWLEQYGNLEEILAHAATMAGKIGENLRAAREQLPLSRSLVTIRTDVDLALKPTDLTLSNRDTDSLRALYTRYGFNQGLKELDSGAVLSPSPAPVADQQTAVLPVTNDEPIREEAKPGRYECITTTAALQRWLRRLQSAALIAVDTETTSLQTQRAQIVGVSLAIEAGEAAYIPLAHDYPGVPQQLPREATLAQLRPILEDPQRPKLMQNAKYDIEVLAKHGITLQGLAHDSRLESYVLNATATRHDMDSLASRYLGYSTIKYTEVAGKGAKQIPFSQVGLDEACPYAAEDADITLRLHQALWPQLQREVRLRNIYETIEMPLVPVLARMEQHGVLIDAAELRRQSRDLAERMHTIEQQAHSEAGHSFNLDSPKQLQAILFEQLGLPIYRKTPRGQASTNEEALAAIAARHPLPRLILEYRTLAKLRSTYTVKLPEMIDADTGRVHTSYHQAVAGTGRLSSSDPNLQNIPVRSAEGRRIRAAFIAPPGWKILSADYSQIELRIMAHLSADPGLLAAFHAGHDVHRTTAAEVFSLSEEQVTPEQRRAAKAINFGLIYGMSAFGLARQLDIGRHEAQAYMDRYFQRYPNVQAYMESTRKRARRDGYVETLFGRRLYLQHIAARNAAHRAGAERAAINAPMQGTAADIIKRAMLAVDTWLHGHQDAYLLMQVHDELVLEVQADAVDSVRDAVRKCMADAAELSVPLVVDIGVGKHWDEAH